MKKQLINIGRTFTTNRKLLVSTFLSLLIIIWIRQTYLPFSTGIKKISSSRKDLVVYHDFDQDGQSEKINIEFYFPSDEYTVYIYDHDGEQRYRINIGRWAAFRYKYYFGDYNQDGVDELYLLNKKDKHLIFMIYDFNKNLLVLNKAVAEYQRNRNDDILSLMQSYSAKMVGLHDVNRDGIKEAIIFYNQAGQYLESKILAVDVNSGKIIRESDIFKAYFGKVEFVNADKDPFPEIIMYPRRIYKKEEKFADPQRRNWIYILDDDFKILAQHQFQKNIPSRSLTLFYENGQPLLIEKVREIRRGKEKYHINILNFHWEVLASQSYEYGKLITKIMVTSHFGTSFFCVPVESEEKTRFLIYKYPINPVKAITIEGTGYKAIDIINTPDDDVVAFVYANSSQIIFINLDGKLIARAPIDAPYRYFHHTWRTSNGKLILGLNTLDNYFEFNLHKNYLYTYAVAFFLIFNLFIYGLFLSADAVYREYWASKLLKSTAINKAPRGILLLNQDGDILFYNRNIEKFFKLDLSSEKGLNIDKIFIDFPPVLEFMKKILHRKTPHSQEIAFLNGPHLFNGQIIGIPLKKVLLLKKMFYIEIEDFSQPIHMDRLKIWYDAVNKMVHDIKTPLATIGINLQLLRYKLKDSDLPEKDDNLKKFDIIEKELNRVREISREFLRFSNLSSPKFEKFDLIKFINRILKKMLPLYMDKINLEFFPEDKELLVKGDPRLLELLFDILIENSVQAIDGKGRIQIYLKKNVKKSTVTVHIEDNGHGLSPQEMERIFEPFYTTKEGGSGMGLVFAQKIVKDHGYWLQVRSEKGKGTVFFFDLTLQ